MQRVAACWLRGTHHSQLQEHSRCLCLRRKNEQGWRKYSKHMHRVGLSHRAVHCTQRALCCTVRLSASRAACGNCYAATWSAFRTLTHAWELGEKTMNCICCSHKIVAGKAASAKSTTALESMTAKCGGCGRPGLRCKGRLAKQNRGVWNTWTN